MGIGGPWDSMVCSDDGDDTGGSDTLPEQPTQVANKGPTTIDACHIRCLLSPICIGDLSLVRAAISSAPLGAVVAWRDGFLWDTA